MTYDVQIAISKDMQKNTSLLDGKIQGRHGWNLVDPRSSNLLAKSVQVRILLTAFQSKMGSNPSLDIFGLVAQLARGASLRKKRLVVRIHSRSLFVTLRRKIRRLIRGRLDFGPVAQSAEANPLNG